MQELSTVRRDTPDGQRRQVTVLFADIVGYTPIAERIGEEATFELIQEITARMAEAVHSENGTVQDYRGDGIMALFGLPIALEDAPLRACRAALKLQKLMYDLEADCEIKYAVRPKTRVGIHAGPVVVGEVGDQKSARSTAVGDTVNLASRLESEAGAGEVFLSEDVAVLVGGQAEVSFVGERLIKGKSKPQRVFRLDGMKAGVTRFEAARRQGLTRLVERDHELELLDACLTKSAAGKIEIVDVVGEPGIGKSRLMHEFKQRIQEKNAFVLKGDCRADGITSPFLPFVDLVRTSFDIGAGEDRVQTELKLRRGLERVGFEVDTSVPYLMALLGQRDDTDTVASLSADVIGMRMRQLLLDLLLHSCRNGPVVLFIEDLHWIDPGSEQLLARVARSDDKLPLLVICAFRPHYKAQWADSQNVTTVPLGPLSKQATVRLLSERLGGEDVDGELVRLAVEKAEGNPLYAEEIAKYLDQKRREQPDFDLGAKGIVLPANLQNLVMDRFDTLSDETRSVLQTAAVTGRKFHSELLRDILGPGIAIADRLRLAEEQELILRIEETDADYVFKHALVQDAIYSTLMTPQKRALHARVGEAIERNYPGRTEEMADSLAHHYDQSDNYTKAIRFLALAGRKSLNIFSLEVADDYLARAVELIDSRAVQTDDDFYVGVLEDWLEVQQWRADFGRTISIFEPRMAFIERFAHTDRYARIIALLGVAYAQTHRFDEGETLLLRALSIGEVRNDPEAIAHGCLGLMCIHCMRRVKGSSAVVEELAARVLSVAYDKDDLYYRTYARFYLSWSTMIRGDIDSALRIGLETIAIGRNENYPGAIGFGATAAAYTESFSENYAQAIEYADEGSRSAGGIVDKLVCLAIKGLALAMAGDGASGLTLLRDIDRQLTDMQFFSLKNIVNMPIGLALATVGEIASGLDWLNQSIVDAVTIGNLHGAAVSHVVAGEIYYQMTTGTKKLSPDMMRKNMLFLIRTLPFAKSKAMQHFDEAIALGRRAEMHGVTAQALLNKGIVLRSKRKHAEAVKVLREARAEADKVEWRRITERIDEQLAALS